MANRLPMMVNSAQLEAAGVAATELSGYVVEHFERAGDEQRPTAIPRSWTCPSSSGSTAPARRGM